MGRRQRTEGVDGGGQLDVKAEEKLDKASWGNAFAWEQSLMERMVIENCLSCHKCDAVLVFLIQHD